MEDTGSAAPIRVFNRYTGELETERVYGEDWLRWCYETSSGRVALALAAGRIWFSRLYGLGMRLPRTRHQVAPFVERYGIDASEFAEPVESFDSFNAFFKRALAPGARPIDPDPDSVVFPADGRHRGFARARNAGPLWIKGEQLELARLVGDAALADSFADGPLVLSRLCPVDYHRFHFPVAGVPEATRQLPGRLLSVSPIALRRRRGILSGNQRAVTRLKTLQFGSVAIVEIGATCVGSIVQTHVAGQPVEKGQEKGYFQYGGSATATLFEPGVELADDLLEQTRLGRELYARMGDAMGRRVSAAAPP